MNRSGSALIAVAAAALLHAGTAEADVFLDFETPALNECTAAGTQFSGVQFVTGPAAEGYPSHLPYVMTSGAARSGVRSLQSGVGCGYEPGVIARTALRVAQTRAGVSLYVRQDEGSVARGYQLRALDAAGNRIDTNGDFYVSLPPATTAYSLLTAGTADNTNRIATVQLVPQVEDQNVVLRFDDLTLADGPSPPQPDFSMGPSPALVVPQGGSSSVIVPVTRYNGAAGYRTDTLQDVPPGVTASASPNYSEDAARIDASASLDAPTGSRPPLTITGTPDGPGLGPGPRSTQVPVVVTATLPTVTIVTPAEGTVLDRLPFDLTVGGTFVSPRANPSGCAVVTQSPARPEIPATCASVTPSGTRGDYSITVTEGFAPGANHVHVFLRDSGGHVAHASREFRIADETTDTDLRISGVELTQGAQRYSTAGGLAIPRLPGMNTIEYGGVQLVAEKPLFVRVFASTIRTSHPSVTARLRVTRNGVEIPGSPFAPTNGPQGVSPGGLYASNTERGDGTKGFLFEIASPAPGPLVIDAEINDGPRPVAECATCRQNNQLRVTNVRFRPTKILHIYPVRFTDGFMSPCPAPRERETCPKVPQGTELEIFTKARAMFPFRIAMHTWVADMDITEDQRTAAAAIARWDREHPTPGPNERRPRNEDWIVHRVGDYERRVAPPGTVIGVGRGSFAGMNYKTLYCCNPLRVESVDIVEELRPLTSVAHEYGHALGLDHSDRGPNRPDGDMRSANLFGCGGGSRGETSDSEWPDLRGTLVGFAYDPFERKVIPAYDGANNAVGYDFLSYCANDANSWISSRSWDRLVNDHNNGAAVRAAGRAQAGPAGPALAVSVVLDPDGTDAFVTDVQPVPSGAQDSNPGGTYEVAVLDGAGGTISSTRVVPEVVHADAEGAPSVGLAVSATVPSSSTARAFELRRDGVVLAGRQASATAPEVRLLAPRAGTRVGQRGTLLVRWRGTDADGDTLRYAVDQATAPSGPWRTVGAGYTGTSARIAIGTLRPSNNARIRVRALDGFRESEATSGRLRIASRPPQVDIISPLAGMRVRADAALTLDGQAVDADNKLVSDRRLVWRDGRRVIGRGATVAAADLRPGRRTLSLTATDGARRRGVAKVRVRVTRVTPRLLTLEAPASAAASARTLTLRVAASVSGRLTVTGSGARGGARVSRRTRTVRVRIPRGTQPLQLQLRVVGGGGKATIPVTVQRG